MKTTGQDFWSVSWRQLRRNPLAMGGMWFVALLFLLATYAPYISCQVPFRWEGPEGVAWPFFHELFNRNIVTSVVDLGFNILSLLLPVALLACQWLSLKRVLMGTVGLLLGGLLLVLWLNPREAYTPYPSLAYGKPEAVFPPVALGIRSNDTLDTKKPPGYTDAMGRKFWFGSDDKGRDVLSLILYGTRISLTIGLLAVSIYVFIGVILGSLAGYLGGWVDMLISRLVEMMICFPSLIIIMTMVAFIPKGERSIFHVMLVIGITSWTGVARLVRAEFLRLRNLDFTVAARALGGRNLRVIFRHVLPNALGPVIVSAALGVPAAILTESGLSFLGLGDVESPSWGQVLYSGRNCGVADFPWMIHTPGIAIFLTVSAMNLLGDGLRDALDPKLRGR
ncbi:MAG: ABC transporter permease [Planctomycetota bacterium]